MAVGLSYGKYWRLPAYQSSHHFLMGSIKAAAAIRMSCSFRHCCRLAHQDDSFAQHWSDLHLGRLSLRLPEYLLLALHQSYRTLQLRLSKHSWHFVSLLMSTAKTVKTSLCIVRGSFVAQLPCQILPLRSGLQTLGRLGKYNHWMLTKYNEWTSVFSI
jgi:hypothetical protein